MKFRPPLLRKYLTSGCIWSKELETLLLYKTGRIKYRRNRNNDCYYIEIDVKFI